MPHPWSERATLVERDDPRAAHPWPALWAMVIGFFMILVDSTIVSVATPAIMVALDADIAGVVWVSSAYLLAFAVPLLVTGRLGDRFGIKRVYLTGLVVFTLASLACGLAASLPALIAARVVQGLGASLMSPQSMALITRLFAPTQRGAAMGLWGAVAGVASLAGPILGGVLTDAVGWSWIFFVNVPVGIVAFVAVWRLVPRLATHVRTFDWLGVVLSGVALFLIVFGLQEGQTHDWGALWGPITVWGLIGVGVLVMGGFLAWQARNPREPLLPLTLFRDRNFSLANGVIATMGFALTGMTFPMMLFTQSVLGFTPTQAALLTVPAAVLTAALSPTVGRRIASSNPRSFVLFGLGVQVAALALYATIARPGVAWPLLLLPSVLQGLGGATFWGPNSVTATRNLPPSMAGAGSGVYNATRQLGAVLGSAAIAAMMEWRVAAHLGSGGSSSGVGAVPEPIAEPFARAMGESLLLPAAALAAGMVVAVFFLRPDADADARHAHLRSQPGAPA